MYSMKSTLAAVVLLCALHSTFAGRAGISIAHRTLLNIPSLKRVKASCRTKAKVSLVIGAPGKADVSANSSCTAFASSISAIQEVWDEYLKVIKLEPNKTCTVVRLQDTIDLCAQSVAKVYTSAQGEINIKGDDAKACFEASSDGDAFAQSFAYVFVNMWLGVVEDSTSAEAEAQVGALTHALAEVWAGAKTSACQQNTGSVSDAQESYAAQVRVALACVFAEVAVKFCKESYIGKAGIDSCDVCKDGELESFFVATESSAQARVCSSTQTVVDIEKGNAKTEDREPTRCAGKPLKCCDDVYDNQQTCLCGRGCSMSYYQPGVWETPDKKSLCYCEDKYKPED